MNLRLKFFWLLVLALPAPRCKWVEAQTSAKGAGAASVDASPQNTASSLPSLDAIVRMIDKGQAKEALDQLGAATAQQPVPAGVWRTQGQAFYALNQFAGAEKAFAAAVSQDPQDLEALQMRGLTLFRLGRPADAIPWLSQAQQWGPGTKVDPSYVLALCYLDTRRYDDARRAFALQYGFAPDSARSYLLSARMLLRRGFTPIAGEFARKAVEMDPELPLAHELLGEVELAGNHLDEAIAEFEKERARNPLEPGTYDRLGDAYVRAGKYQMASHTLQQAILLEPTSTGPYILLGKVLIKQQAPANAAMYLERAKAMDPSNYMTRSLLGQAYRLLGRSEDANAETQASQRLQQPMEPKLGGPQ